MSIATEPRPKPVPAENKWSDGVDFSIALVSGDSPLPAVRSPEMLEAILVDRFSVIPAVITTPAEAKLAQNACGEIRTWNALIEARRKDLKQPSLDFGRYIDESSSGWKAVLDKVQKELMAKRKVYEDAKAKELAAKQAEERRIAAEIAARERQTAIDAALAEQEAKMAEQQRAAAIAAEQARRAQEESDAQRRVIERQQAEQQAQQQEFARQMEEMRALADRVEAERATMAEQLAQLQREAEERSRPSVAEAFPEPLDFGPPLSEMIEAAVDTVPDEDHRPMSPLPDSVAVGSDGADAIEQHNASADAADLRAFAKDVYQAWGKIPTMRTEAGDALTRDIDAQMRMLVSSINESAKALEAPPEPPATLPIDLPKKTRATRK